MATGGNLPIRFEETVQLTNLGVNPASIGFNNVTLESDQYVCIRQNDPANPSGGEVYIVNLKNNNELQKRPMKADAAIMHWHKNVIALKAAKTLQVYDLTQRAKLKSFVMEEDIAFWKWISIDTIGIVTETSVYHWNIFDGNVSGRPEKIFERNPNLAGCQIINYRLNDDDKWMVVVGIAQRDNRVVGQMQLYSKERGISQSIEGHAAAFGTVHLDGAATDTRVFTFANRGPNGSRLHVVEIDHQAGQPVFQKQQKDIFFPAEAGSDFPVSMQTSHKYGIAYMVTKYGFIHLYDLETANCIFMNRISSETIFTTSADSESAGIVAINRKGQVLHVSVDEDNIIPYLLRDPANAQIAIKLASRAGLSGADSIYEQQFEALCASGNWQDAAKVAATSPRGILRNLSTIERFRSANQTGGGPSVLIQYFGMLLDKGKLNEYESVELAKPVLQQGRKNLIDKWFNADQLACTEELADLVRPFDLELATKMYVKAQVHHKVIAGLAETGQFDKILPYSQSSGYTPDYTSLLAHIIRINPERGAEFATSLANNESGSLVDIDRVVDIFQSQNMIQQATAFLLDALKENNPDQAALQTRVLELNLVNAPQVADAILGNEMFSYYDKTRIAALCEQAGLFQRALENTQDPATVKRLITKTDKFQPEWLVNYFGTLNLDQTIDCLDEMLKVNMRQNLQSVVNIAIKYSELLGPVRLIDLFEKHKTAEGLYHYLGSIVNVSEDPDVAFKYIEAATVMGNLAEVQRIVRSSNSYDPVKVKNFLKEARLADQLPLIIVADRFNFVHELVLYLYQNQQFQSIEIYVQQVNPGRAPEVIGGLLDVDCDEAVIKKLLASVNAAAVPIDELVDQVESRNRLKILLPFLEATLASGNQQQAVYNALAKIYIDSNNAPEKFLTENDLYDTLIVGKYCEKRDPNLAYIAYRKGQNDVELIGITNENSMYKAQARYLLDRADSEVWAHVLSENNIHRRQLLDQVTATAVPESSEPEKVSIAVKALLEADLPSELIDLLEKIILEPSAFSDNANLQNLLMFTAAKADKGKLMGYIHDLSAYDPDQIAPACINVGLYEEAFEIYKKQDNHIAATDVLVEHVVSIDRAAEYAERVDTPEVWSKVAKAQLDGVRVSDSIQSYIKAQDPSNYAEVIDTSIHAGKNEDLITYLKMARKTLREPPVDTALAFAYARTDKLSELEDFLHSPNVADVEKSGDQAAEEGLHQAAKIFYSSISNWGKLATTLVHLDDYQGAVDAARKANSVKVWKQVNEVCVSKKEFALARICGLNLIVHAEELQAIVKQYEREGYFDELIALLNDGLSLERAHMGIFTELGIAYTKYHPEKTMEFLKLFWQRLNIPKMIKATEEAALWPELVFLYSSYDEPDNAALTLIERAADAWEHQSFKDIVVKVANLEIYYKSLNFYLEQQPSLLVDLLKVLTPRVDVNRVVRMFEKSENTPLIKPFLQSVQHQNKRAVNDAINELLIEEEDYKTLRDSVNSFDNYDAVALAQRLENHDLVFFRQIAASIYRKNKRWEKSISLSKSDKLYKDAIETAATSQKADVVEELLRYFVDIGARECYAAMLYTCYNLIPLGLVMEMSWRYGLNDFSQPYIINYMSEQAKTVAELKKDNEERKSREAKVQKEEDNTPILGGSRLMLTAGPAGSSPSPIPYQHTNGFTPQATGYQRAF